MTGDVTHEASGDVDEARDEVATEFFGGLSGRSIVRLIPTATRRLLMLIVGVLIAFQAPAGFALAAWGPGVSNRAGLVGLDVVVIAVGAFWIGAHYLLPTLSDTDRAWTIGVPAMLVVTTIFTTLALIFLGSGYILVAVDYLVVAIFAVYELRRPWAVGALASVAVAFGIVLLAGRGYTSPLVQWLIGVGGASFIAVGVGGLIARADRVAESERQARAEVDELNRTLEQRVTDQVEELGRLGRLRRFLSPQVADALLTSGDEAILQPHRRQIAVFFCDLRGFTTFTGGAEAEEVVEALDAYYDIVGSVLRRHDATVGTFAGDGIMAYLNDPVPCDDPAGTAVQMAIELREPMAAFVDTWKRRGYDLGYGVGIAYGYATLGTIGFEGRNDYTALGSVVNLAARLCGEAASGEVLVDGRTCDALGQRFATLARQVSLKGFASPVAAFEVA